MTMFWRVFYIINGIAIALFIAVFVWEGFNIHERLPYVLIAQFPPLAMMAIRRLR